jgi:hypothetical protein
MPELDGQSHHDGSPVVPIGHRTWPLWTNQERADVPRAPQPGIWPSAASTALVEELACVLEHLAATVFVAAADDSVD